MAPIGLAPPLPADSTVPPVESRKAREVAQEFESLLIAQLLRSFREDGGGCGWLGTGADQAGVTMAEFAEQAIARSLSAQGGLGLAALIESGLRDQADKLMEPAASAIAKE